MNNTAVCKCDRTLKSNKADWLDQQNILISGLIVAPASSTRRLVKVYFEQGGLFGLKNIATKHVE